MPSLLAALVLLAPAGPGTVQPVSFVHDVLPVLTRQGCNAAACHGSPAGKGGFRLSLRGYDPTFDEQTLLREALGRRVNRLQPEESMVLRKPLLLIPHEGGQKLRFGSTSQRILLRWIAEGCRTDLNAPACVRLEVSPTQQTLTWPRKDQALTVRAHYADGSSRDVTHLADFTSTDETVAAVSPEGLIQGRERGETTIVARYGEQVALCRYTLLREVPGFAWPAPPENNHIDTLVFERLKRLSIPPSPLCGDTEFIRRLYLDVLGILPAAGEVQTFLADTNPDRRNLLIDQVLQRPECADYWAHRWGDLLQVKPGKLSRTGADRMHAWLLDAARTNMPFDAFARSLLTSKGSTYTNPPANFFRTSADPFARAENIAQLFLGARIQCAKCHNHPGDTWTQDAYHGIGAFFARVEQKPAQPGEVLVSLAASGEITQPLSKKTARPMLPGVGLVAVTEGRDRRELFTDWLLRADNPFFARVAVNRVWGNLLGRGLVEPIDDFRIANPPAHPELLDRLAGDFIRDGYDLKKLTRTILRSRVYQLSSRALPLNANDSKYFSRVNARMLPAEVLLDAICQVTGVPETYPGRPPGTRATQLPGPEGENLFLRTFGQPARDTVCTCERSQEPKLAQPLELIGGEMLARKLHGSRSRISRLFDDPDARLRVAGQPPREGLVLWLDAARGVKAPAVSEWLDQSSGQRHVRQAAPQHQPRLIPDAIAGQPAVRFDGKDDFLHNTTLDLIPSGSPRTLLVAGRAGSAGGALFSFRRQSTGGKPVFVAQQGAFQGSYYVYTDGVNGAENSSLPLQTLDKVREPFVSVHVSAGAGKKLQVRLNGVEQKVMQAGAVGKEEGTAGFVVGNREDTPVTTFPWDGDLAEVLVYDRVLTPAELALAERYLATRYNLPAAQNPVAMPVSALSEKETRKLLVELYLSALSREPTVAEVDTALAHLAEVKDRRAALEDIFWAVLNTKEFLFQH